MKTVQWKPLRDDGSIDEAELRRPAETAEPTTWEVTLFDGSEPIKFEGYRVAEIFGVAALAPEHQFRVTLANMGRAAAWFWIAGQEGHREQWCANEAIFVLPDDVTFGIRLKLGNEWPIANVTIVSPVIASQAEADTVLPALLSVKAVRREAVFAPTEAIDLSRWIAPHECCHSCGHVEEGLRLDENGHAIDACVNCGDPLIATWGDEQTERWENRRRYTEPRDSDDGPQIHAIRVRGDETPLHPAHVRALRDQARDAGVEFSLRWGEWLPIDAIPAWEVAPSGASKRHLKNESGGSDGFTFGVSGEKFQHYVRRYGSKIDGVDYPEET